jgi:tetratricopeptide (TPR) repeat protein
MYSEAWMNTMPWNYWSDSATPRPETVPVIAALETIIARSPRHPLGLHLYIHAIEASATPQKAEAAADTLLTVAPGSGHLVHMPAHIFWRVGRYNDAAEANVEAAKVDEAYIAACKAQGFYPAMYYPHNIHFLWAAASMEGRGAVAIEAARKVAANVRLEQIQQFPTVEFFHTIPLLSLVQFGHWDEILAEPQPAADLAFSNAIWRYARGVALANKGDVKGARAEQAALVPLKANDKVMFLDGNDYPASQLLAIADNLLLGEIALASGDNRTAVARFTEAVAGQDALPYTEPPFWYYPTRQSLGLALLKAGNATEAEAVYRKDLEIYPHNGWSTFGLIQALDAQKKTADADMLRMHFKEMWALADVELKGSRVSAFSP